MKGAKPFLDTNILLYLFSGDPVKADVAENVVAAGGIISTQVLNEFAAVARRKMSMSYPEIRESLVPILQICEVAAVTLETHVRGLEMAERYGFSVWDGLIVASAVMAGCSVLYTEDLQNGQVLDAVVIVTNPF